MDNQKLTQAILTGLRWNLESWLRCPNGHWGIYVLGAEWEGKRLRGEYRCPKCGKYSYYFCLSCFSQHTRLDDLGRVVCLDCGAVQKAE